ncbi:MAG TPA: XrtB/PEP-CTERM-associated polysaccharide biosynthesis outer membrane protein EpsL [Ramlibacter sp.]|nr:XrtB/PEP-CTERM-associated polysaccharide biosynthesis outer membrane protein EpsL [Ramlibacter sp.]
MTSRLALAPLALLCAQFAHAQVTQPTLENDPGKTLQFRVGAGMEHDSNVLRSSTGSSDQIGILSAGVRLDKQYSLQRITLDAEAATYRHRDFSNLNYNTFNYLGALNLSLTPRIRGLLSAERRQYRDITDPGTGVSGANLRTERNEIAEIAYDIGGGIRTQAGLTRRSSESDDPRSLEASPTVVSARVAAGYEFPSGTLLMGQYRRGNGDYGNVQVGQDFKETEPSIIARWPVTPKTTVDGRIGRLERKHDNVPQRDFNGTVGAVNVNWEITGKTSVNAGYAREVGSYEFAGGGDVRGNRIHIEPLWKATAKTAVRLRYQREERDWNTVSAASPDAGRSDTTQYSSAAFEWEPRRHLLVSAALRNERRSSNLPGFDFKANILALGAKAYF